MSGMIATAIEALVPAAAYLATGRNLWVPIIMHGTSDTLGFIFIFLHK
jgi:membrane protease YdiL (CAAX protease family)